MSTTNEALYWAWGRFLPQFKTGKMARLWLDTVLPYSKPATFPITWPVDKLGQFEGYERNMGIDPAGIPNFDGTHFLFNIVIVTMLGLKNSPTAPYRPTTTPVMGVYPDQEWPFNLTDGANTFMQYYIDNYLDPETYLIVMIPERELMNLAEDHYMGYLGDAPDFEAGQAAIASFMSMLLDPVTGIQDRILGWYLIDEPELPQKQAFASPQKVANARARIREIETYLRVTTFGETGFDESKLRPCIISHSALFAISPHPTGWDAYYPDRYAREMAGDIYAFDRQPYRRGLTDMQAEWPAVVFPADQGLMTLLTDDPIVTLELFDQFRRMINPTAQVGDTDYRPLLNWSQAIGFPWRALGTELEDGYIQPTPGPEYEPAMPPRLNPGIGGTGNIRKPELQRYYRRPMIDEARFYCWASLLRLSEGAGFFAQYHLPDLGVDYSDPLHPEKKPVALNDLVALARELGHFERMRWDHRVLNGTIPKPAFGYGSAPLEGFVRLPPIWLYVDYPSPPPQSGPETWLIIVNRDPRTLSASFSLTSPIPGAALEGWRFLQPDGFPKYPLGRNPVVLTIPGHRAGLYKVVSL
ncbi:MAG: hypothetical protein ABI743_02865 [bacterium]